MLRSSVVAPVLLLSLLAASCAQQHAPDQDPDVAGVRVQAMVLAPGWVTGTTWPAETVLALNSVAARSTSLVSGDVAVLTAGTGAFLSGAAELAISTNAEITGNVRADTIDMQVAGHVLGAAAYNTLSGSGTIDGAKTASLTTPVPITIVAASNFTANTTLVDVASSTLVTRSAGTYGLLNVRSGTRTAKTILRLNGGTYNVSDIVLGDYARIECKAACEIRVKNRVSVASYSYIGPGHATSNSLTMDMVKLYVEGSNGAAGPSGLPAAAAFGTRSELKAFTFVPNGTLVLGSSVSGVGKFIAKDVEIGSDTELMTGSSSQRVLRTPYVVGPSWPTELATAWNSIDLLSSNSSTGNFAVINNGVGSFLNTSEAVLGTNATITGYLRADKVELKAGAKVTAAASYNTIVNAGTIGAAITPLPLPLDMRLPVFPVITSGSSTYTVAASADRTLAAGRVRDLIVNAGVSTDRTTLTLSGGVYEMRDLTLGAYSTLTCSAACEIRVKRNLTTGDNTILGPAAGLDASKVKVFAYDDNSAAPNTTPFAVSFGTNSKVDAFVFAARGTLETKAGAVVSGRFVARDIRFGSGSTSLRAGITEIAPVITQSPQSLTLTPGQSAIFTVVASGTDAVFQWKRGGALIAGATAGTYTLASAVLGDSGASFTVTVSNSAGSVTSAAAILTVNACNPATYVPTATACGIGACARSGTRSCVAGSVVDSCMAGTPAANDVTCNGIDDDCSGIADEDYASLATTCAVGACASTGATSCVGGVVRDSCTSLAPAPNDTTCDGRDDDCNGTQDEDYASSATSCGVGACLSAGVLSCVAGAARDSCTPGNPGPSDSDCDGIDDDCDGEADQDYNSASTNCGVGACARTGILDCVAGAVLNTCAPGTPAVSDATCNGIDDDCNGSNDEDYVSLPTSCGTGSCTSAGTTSCVSASVQNSCVVPTADQDGDSTPDCSDGCPNDAAKIAPGACGCSVADTDSDGDSTPNCLDACPQDPQNDADGDTVCGNLDNCPDVANAGQQDSDGDLLGDACDIPKMVSLTAGGEHSCALLQNAQVGCWGDNSLGQLGDGTHVAAITPALVPGLSGITEIAAGHGHTCALRSSAALVCWGDNASGQLGNGSTLEATSPVAVSGISDATQISAGFAHSCALRGSGAVLCWGDNQYGQLGNNTKVSSTTPVPVSGLTDAVQIAVGYGHSCALRTTGVVTCWGGNFNGQLGNNSLVDSKIPVPVSGITGAVQVATGVLHSCALSGSGAVQCWGANWSGQLGNGTLVDAKTPVAVSGITDALQLGAGQLHSCALRQTGTVQCWGDDAYGQLGNGTLTHQLTPVTVSSLAGAVEIVAGDLHSCALRSTGDVRCWGDGEKGQLGHSTAELQLTPSLVIDMSNAAELAAGSYSTCALHGTGAVSCWGVNSNGELGCGSLEDSTSATLVSGVTDAVAVSSGDAHGCAVRAGGQVVCWGYGGDGQLGDGSFASAAAPVTVSGISDAVGVAAGVAHSCAVRASGQVMCWGYGGDGELGDGSFADAGTPVAVSGISDAISVATGVAHSCAVRAGGQVMCWGDASYGRLGDGSGASAGVPLLVSGITSAVAVVTGDYHSCALLTGGAVRCWGRNAQGQLGNGGVSNASTPVAVSGIVNAVSLAAGSEHVCVALASGVVRCWGANADVQLGDGQSSLKALSPTSVLGISDALLVSAGLAHSCAALASGEVRCWGNGGAGRLGNGYPWAKVPVQVLWSEPP